MREVLNIQSVYLIQEEDTDDHFHMWLFPKYPWMDELNLGRKVQAARPILEYAREHLKTEENLKLMYEDISKLQEYFSQE